jgi:hypothetical protein
LPVIFDFSALLNSAAGEYITSFSILGTSPSLTNGIDGSAATAVQSSVLANPGQATLTSGCTIMTNFTQSLMALGSIELIP